MKSAGVPLRRVINRYVGFLSLGIAPCVVGLILGDGLRLVLDNSDVTQGRSWVVVPFG